MVTLFKQYFVVLIIIQFLIVPKTNNIYANDTKLKIVNPLFIYPDTITLLILPINEKSDSSIYNRSYAVKIMNNLSEKGDFNYTLNVPQEKDIERIYEEGFKKEVITGRLTQYYPVP